MENLLKETLEILSKNGKHESDVEWCGIAGSIHFSWEEFKILANQEYDNGYGGVEVLSELLVVGKDFWLERHEYDGSEWWEFKSYPVKPPINKIPEFIVCDSIY